MGYFDILGNGFNHHFLEVVNKEEYSFTSPTNESLQGKKNRTRGSRALEWSFYFLFVLFYLSCKKTVGQLHAYIKLVPEWGNNLFIVYRSIYLVV